MRMLITGMSGFIGSMASDFFSVRGWDVAGLDIAGDHPFLQVCDLRDAEMVRAAIARFEPDVVFHLAGLSNLKGCEADPDKAWSLNVDGTRHVLEAIAASPRSKSIKLVFMSSDYVFDGEGGNYSEDDEPRPRTVYGQNKLEAETLIRDLHDNAIICRSANVFGWGGNFYSFLLSQLESDRTTELYDDVFYTPTYVGYLLASLQNLIKLDFCGTIHIAGPERVNRYEFGCQMADVVSKSRSLLVPVCQPSDGLLAADSSLNCERAQRLLSNALPSITKSLHYCTGVLQEPYFSFEDARGGLLGVCNTSLWAEVNYIESVGDAVRGGHYHEGTTEMFFIISGSIEVTLADSKGGHESSFMVKKGDIIRIPPGRVHTFQVLEPSTWINMLSQTMDRLSPDIHRPGDVVAEVADVR